MKITQLSHDKKTGKMVFLAEKTTPALINSIRRAIINDVPTMAIEDVEFRKNDSVLYDELLAHRLGLIPFTTDLKSYFFRDECSCNDEGCAKCTLNITCKVVGPKIVTAKDLVSKDPKVIPVYEDMVIVKLLENQELEFEATATLGRGKEHTKWTPGLVFFKAKPIITIKKQPEKPEEFVKAVPHKILVVKSGKVVVDEGVLLNNPLASDALPESDLIEIDASETDFVFYVESWGQLSAPEMVQKATSILEAKADVFEKEFKATSG